MNPLNQGIGRVFDLVLAPFAGAPAWGMVVVSLLTAVWALLLFKAVTPQARLAAARDRLFGHIYEMGLFQDHLRVVARIQRDLARANLRYLAYSLPALVALLIPMILTLGQLDARYARRPLQPGETTVFTVTLAPGAAARVNDLRLDAPAGVTVEAGPVRDPAAGAAAWRLRADAPGRHAVAIRLGDTAVADGVVTVGGRLPRLSETRSTDWLAGLLHPGGAMLPGEGPVREVSLQLPARTVRYLGLEMHWLVAFMVFSLLGGLAVKDLLRVEI